MRLSPGSFNHRNSEVWWNCLRSAVCIIDTSDERHSHSVLFDRSLTLHLAVASLKKIWQANQPIRRSVEKITSADYILEIEPKRTSNGKSFTTAKFWRTTGLPFVRRVAQVRRPGWRILGLAAHRNDWHCWPPFARRSNRRIAAASTKARLCVGLASGAPSLMSSSHSSSLRTISSWIDSWICCCSSIAEAE